MERTRRGGAFAIVQERSLSIARSARQSSKFFIHPITRARSVISRIPFVCCLCAICTDGIERLRRGRGSQGVVSTKVAIQLAMGSTSRGIFLPGLPRRNLQFMR